MAGLEGRVWILAAAYMVVAVETFVVGRNAAPGRERFFWAAISIALLLLGLAKQLHLQGRSTDWLRTSAREHHLYGERTVGQYLFLVVLILAGILLFRPFRDWIKNSPNSVASAAFAMIALLAFILIRAASIHALDPAMTMQVAGLRSGWWVELMGLFAIAVAAGAFLKDQRR